jgi:hypothetical protein
MDLTVTIDDAHAAILQRRFGDARAYVQGRISDWLTQIAGALAEAEHQDLLTALAGAPADVRDKVAALLEPHQPQRPPERPPRDLEG